MSGRITFQSGPFQGWTVVQDATRIVGHLVAIGVAVTTPLHGGTWERLPVTGEMLFQPGVDGFDIALAAERDGGPVRMAELLQWVIEANARALVRRQDLTPDKREHWQQIIDAADDTRADFYARQTDGVEPAARVPWLQEMFPALAGAR